MKAEIERFYTCNRSPNNVHNKVRLVELQGLCGLTKDDLDMLGGIYWHVSVFSLPLGNLEF